MDPFPRLVVLISTGMDEYQTRLVAGISPVLSQHGHSLLVCVNDPRVPGPPPSLRMFLQAASPCGFITTNCMAGEEEASFAALLESFGRPVVRIGVETPDGTWIRGDNVTGMRAVVAHLVDDCGARTVAHVRGIPHQPDAIDRERVFREELARRGLVPDEELVVDGRFDQETSYWSVRRLLKARPEIDAVAAANDLSALGALRAARAAGLRVPDDIMITGFDNEATSALNWPGLTSVDQDLENQGTVAARQLVAEMKGKPPGGEIMVPSRLVVRGTTRPSGASPVDQNRLLREIAEGAYDHLSGQDAALGLNRSLFHCTTLDAVVDVLAEKLDGLGVGRCFVVLHQRPLRTAAGDPPGPGRLLLDFREGKAHPPPQGWFPTRLLLPEDLRHQIGTGALMVQALSAGGRELGYVLFERGWGPVKVGEVLLQDLSRTLEAISSTEQLQLHAVELEELVQRRTHELAEEVTTRRRAEVELQRANTELQRLLKRDGLTSIANRAAFESHLADHWRRLEGAEHGERKLALLMIDIDAFKQYNDHYGHVRGDQALRTVASCLHSAVREPADLACRYGGEEFAVLLPDSGARAALAVAKRFHGLLAKAAVPHAASPVAPRLTASTGIAVSRTGDGNGPTGLVEAADRALYRAKALGRDRIVLSGSAEPADPATLQDKGTARAAVRGPLERSASG